MSMENLINNVVIKAGDTIRITNNSTGYSVIGQAIYLNEQLAIEINDKNMSLLEINNLKNHSVTFL